MRDRHMGCSGCGGNSSIKVVRNSIGSKNISKPTYTPILRPKPTTKIVMSFPKPGETNVALMARQRAKDMKLCPICNATLSTVLSGSGARNRKKCTHCNRVFV